MKSREELLREAAEHPERLVEYISALQEQLGQTGQELTAAQRDLTQQQQHLAAAKEEIHQTKEELRQKTEQLAQAQALIAELKRELFGAKADKLNAQQEEQLRQLVGDVQEQNQRPPPLSRELLEEAVAQERQRFAPTHAISYAARVGLENRRGRLGAALNEADRPRRGAERRRQKTRQERVDHLRRNIAKEAGQAKQEDGGRQAAHGTAFATHAVRRDRSYTCGRGRSMARGGQGSERG